MKNKQHVNNTDERASCIRETERKVRQQVASRGANADTASAGAVDG